MVRDLRAAKSLYLMSICQVPTSGSRSTWKFIRTISKPSTSIPDLIVDDRKVYSDPDKASALNLHFSRCFNYSVPPLFPADTVSLSVSNDDLICSPEGICNIIKSWNCKSSSGPDNIPITLLKPVAHSISTPLSLLFNNSISSCSLPFEWKLADIIPIPKARNFDSVTNYRPISLLSVISKILEKHLSYILVDHLESNKLLSDSQWGFRENRSACNALLEITHFWLTCLNNGKEVIVVFFDFKKAFDSVPHVTLLDSLTSMGVNNHLISWLRCYLSNRSQQVIVNGSSSPPAEVVSGVPQGSILGPILFIIYINGITKVNLSAWSKLTLFADDMSLSYARIVTSSSDITPLQNDIDSIYSWSSSHHLSFNKDKCKYMIFSKKKSSPLLTHPPVLLLGNTSLERVHQYKYLGVTITDDLKWESHINIVCGKARRIIGMLYRNLYFHSSPEFLLHMYKSLVRPHLEYCSIIWDPHVVFLRNRLMEVEKFALQMCLKHWSLPYSDLILLSNIMPLETRRLRSKLHLLYKIMYKLSFMPENIFTLSSYHKSDCLNHSLSLIPYSGSTNYYLSSVVPHMIFLWNSLQFDPSKCDSFNHFKVLLDLYITTQ